MPTRRFETVQTRKTINGTAAPGAVLETTDGSLLVLPFEQWLFYRSNHHIDQQNEVLDARFRQRLSLLYKDLEKLVRVPSNEIKNNWRLGDGQDQNNVLLGRYFPEWAYCSISHRFQPIGAWRAAWNLSGPTPPPYSKPRNDDNFNPPRSVVPRRNQAGQNRNQELEQVRFVLAAPNGEIADIPWERWLTAQKSERLTVTTPNGQKMQATILDFDKNIPVDMHMEYKVLERAGDLGGIILTAKNNAGEAIKDEHDKEARESLAGLYNLRVSRTDLVRKGLLFGQNGKGSPETVGDEFILFRPVIRSSNSIYYAQTLDSLFIPTKLAQCATDIITKIKLQYDTLKPLLGAAFTPKLLLNLFGEDGRDITEKYITDLIDSNFQFTDSIADDSEQLYRQAEFNFITKQQAPIVYKNTLTNKPEMAFSRLKSDKSILGIVAIYRLDQLKMVSVQPSYTRLAPLPVDQVLQLDQYSEEQPDSPANFEEGAMPRKKFITEAGLATKYLPAYESYGEGIFLQLDQDKLKVWQPQGGPVQARLAQLVANHQSSWQGQGTQPPTAEKVLIHTFAHLLMRELEFQCGYPVTSLKERLYVGAEMQGVLIYTVAGSEGSFGGLVSLCDEGGLRLHQLITSALRRATDCASDPICWDASHQGVAGLNLAACAACSLLPETSCEEFNSLLDRRFVVDEEFGFFADVIKAK